MRLYRELITPYASRSVETSRDAESEMLVLPTPLSLRTDGIIEINDPIFPFELEVPPSFRDTVGQLVESFATRPIQRTASIGESNGSCRAALAWMRDHGLVLPTSVGDFMPDWTRIPVGRSALRFQRVDHQTDLVWFS